MTGSGLWEAAALQVQLLGFGDAKPVPCTERGPWAHPRAHPRAHPGAHPFPKIQRFHWLNWSPFTRVSGGSVKGKAVAAAAPQVPEPWLQQLGAEPPRKESSRASALPTSQVTLGHFSLKTACTACLGNKKMPCVRKSRLAFYEYNK